MRGFRPLPSNHEIWGSGVRISSGAPPSTHLRTRFTRSLAGKDCAFEHILAASDANLVIVHLDDVDEGLQVGLSERHRTRGELLTHTAAESLNECGINADCRSDVRLGGVKRSFCPVALGLEAVEPILGSARSSRAVRPPADCGHEAGAEPVRTFVARSGWAQES